MYLKIIKGLWTVFALFFIFVASWLMAVKEDMFGWFGGMPDLTELESAENSIASELYSADGVLLGKYFRENRSPVTYQELPQNLIDALIATEDIRFEEHSGIDLISWGRVISGILTFKLKGGGSTISQQLAKNLFNMRRDQRFEGDLTRMEQGERRGKLNRLLNIIIIKTKEWVQSVRIERAYTKKEIMTMYFNTVDFGRNVFGIKVAAQAYFNKLPNELNIQECAVLVGMLKAPTKYNAISNPETSEARRNVVLGQMKHYSFISFEAYDSLTALPLLTYSKKNISGEHNRGLAPYFRTVVKNELLTWCKARNIDLFADGLKIYTTIDSKMQVYAETAAVEHMKKLQKQFEKEHRGKEPWIDKDRRIIPNFIERVQKRSYRYITLKREYDGDTTAINKVMKTPIKMKVFTWDTPEFEKDTVLSPFDSIDYHKRFLHIGMMAMNPHSGEIKAWVGGINHKFFKFDHVKQGANQPGSVFKPIVYATAIENMNMTPCDKVTDVAVTFQLQGGGTWTARNSDGYSGNTYTLRQALGRSINTIAASLVKKLGSQPNYYHDGVERIITMARRMGITSPLDTVVSLCLGSSDVSVYEIVGAYGTFVNKGTWRKPIFITKITDKNDRVLEEYTSVTREVFSEEKAYVMLHMLKGPTEEKGGTALGLYRYDFRRNNEVAGKTGTTSNHSDGWFMGLTKDLVVGTWVGGDEQSVRFKHITYGQGAKMALPAYAGFAEKVFADSTLGYEKGRFPKPKEELSIELNCTKYGQAQEADPENLIQTDEDDIWK